MKIIVDGYITSYSLYLLQSQLHLFFSFFFPLTMLIPTWSLLADLQANPFEYHDSYWGSCDSALWGFPPVATGKVWLQQMWGSFGAILSEFIFRSEGWFLPRMPIKGTIHCQYWAGEVSRFKFVLDFYFLAQNIGWERKFLFCIWYQCICIHECQIS